MKRFDVGARVVEPTYGLGSVVAVEDAYTRVQFDEHGIKKFLTSMSRLEPSDEPVPAGLRSGKPRKKRAPKKAVEEAEPSVERQSVIPQRFTDTDMPSLEGDTIVVHSAGLFQIASRKSPISLRLLTTLCATNSPPLFRRGSVMIQEAFVVLLPRVQEHEVERSGERGHLRERIARQRP